jgi:hypothetical protein
MFLLSPFVSAKHRSFQEVWHCGPVDGFYDLPFASWGGVISFVIKPPNGFPIIGKYIRVNFMGPPSDLAMFGGGKLIYASIGKFAGGTLPPDSATGPNTTGVPVRLTFGGNNFTPTLVGTLKATSDIIPFSLNQTDTLVIRMMVDDAGKSLGASFDTNGANSYLYAISTFVDPSDSVIVQNITRGASLLYPSVIGVYSIEAMP